MNYVYEKSPRLGQFWHLSDGKVNCKPEPWGKEGSLVSIGIKGYNFHNAQETFVP